ncbi:hypothetical protein [Latilactobacillus fragifolii]|uniref:hypothetical protein n=1 Tax=Latilactobacillus fragifolii TaxID=2814244 RepID=UPI001ABBB6C0|nr:hypothetical protein [Latilactobacillus fragifolii]
MAYQKDKHRKYYKRVLSFFLIGILAISLTAFFRTTSTSKHNTTKTLPFISNEHFTLVKRDYNPQTKCLKIAYALENDLDNQSQEANQTTTTTDAIETLSNIKYRTNVLSITDPGHPLKHTTVKVKDDFIELVVDQVPDDFKLIKVQIAPEAINTKLDTSALKTDAIYTLYILQKDFKTTHATQMNTKAIQTNDYLSYKSSVLNTKIKKLETQNAGYNLDIKQKQKLIKTIKSDMQYDTSDQKETHESQINGYNNTIDQDKQYQLDNDHTIKKLKQQLKELEENKL